GPTRRCWAHGRGAARTRPRRSRSPTPRCGRPPARRRPRPARRAGTPPGRPRRSEEHTSELQSRFDLVCRLLLEKKNIDNEATHTEQHGEHVCGTSQSVYYATEH